MSGLKEGTNVDVTQSACQFCGKYFIVSGNNCKDIPTKCVEYPHGIPLEILSGDKVCGKN